MNAVGLIAGPDATDASRPSHRGAGLSYPVPNELARMMAEGEARRAACGADGV